MGIEDFDEKNCQFGVFLHNLQSNYKIKEDDDLTADFGTTINEAR